MRTRHFRRFLLLLAAGVSLALSLPAASYFPMADADLVRLAPIAVRAEVLDRTTRLGPDGDRELPFTVVTLRSLELYKGMTEETFRVVVAGGKVEDSIWWVPGAPAFEEGQEVVLMLDPLPGRFGEYGLSEFGLSKFDLVADAAGRRFLVRPVFGARADLQMSKREYPLVAASADAAAVPARDAESFLSALRGLSGGTALPEIGYAMPTGGFTRVHSGLRQKWANLGGVEPGNCPGQPCLYRWFFGGVSPDATVFVTGTQTNLTDHYPPCHVDQTCLVSAALNNWHNVANTDIRISGPTTSGNFEVKLDQDVAHDGVTWTTPYNCTNGGVAGIGGLLPKAGTGAQTFKGLTPYYAAGTATISMRRFTCAYPSDYFVDILTHEMGHALGLQHPDQYQSVFSTSTTEQENAAIMFSASHSPAVTTPQADDIQAMQFYYGTIAPGPAPAANFSFSPSSPKSGSAVSFTDTSTNSPTGWLWTFGDSDADPTRDRNPSHVYAAPGTYTVKLIAGSLNGGSTTSKTVAVAQGGVPSVCTPNTTTLCLNAGRFKVTADWQKSDGSSGHGTAVSLTPDTGYFWFFSSTNIEVVTKVIGFCANPFNSYWVFAAGLTNVKVTLTYTDTKNGTIVAKENPQGTAFVAIQDTAAFKTCP